MTAVPVKTLAFAASAVLSCALAACTTPAGEKPRSETAASGWTGDRPGPPDSADVAQGRAIAEQNCSSCHAIDRTSRSPKPPAPPLREVLAMYEADNLAYRFIEGMRIGHDDMPLFDFDVRAADALIAYLKTISAS